MAGTTLSIVVPAYNEEKKINSTFSRLERFFSQKDYIVEYVFVEDGSSDATLEILKNMEKAKPGIVKILVNEKNMGKGYSIKRGMLASSGDYVLFMDVDMATPLQTFTEFEKYLGDYDIVMGSRWCLEANIRIPQPFIRKCMGHVFYALVKTLYLKNVTDTNCGFKCYRKNVANDIFSRQMLRGWGFDVEILYIAQKRGYRIKEVPVVWAHGRGSKVNLLKVPFLTLAELIRIKINDWNGCYK